MKEKILVCCHKQDVMENTYPYYPLHVGKANSTLELGFPGDNTGNNISEKNPSYCELTGLYWLWKNLQDEEVIGVCHYRRYFDFHKQCRFGFHETMFPVSSFERMNREIPREILEKVKAGFVVCAKPYKSVSVFHDYCSNHYSEDYKVLSRVFYRTQSMKMKRAFFRVFQGCELRPCNMFIMSRCDFEAYCQWLFHILDEVEHNIDITYYNATQQRIFGYMGERLLNVWLQAEKLHKLIERPLMLFVDDAVYAQQKKQSLFDYKYHNLRFQWANILIRPSKFKER